MRLTQAQGLSRIAIRMLPPVTEQPFNDGASYRPPPAFTPMPRSVWEDDLLMTGVRSFDVKALDPELLSYVDLGFRDINPSNGNMPGFLQQGESLLRGFGHEGRIPSLMNDFRRDPSYPMFNVGDDNAGVVRLRRVFDTWSTTYTHAPSASWLDPQAGPPPLGTGRPLYPSFPPPYPLPLRGIQIQVRLNNPTSQYIKVLTIRQDFTDKL
jgi:hypothetical protein